MLSLILPLTLVVIQNPPAQTPQARFSAATDLVTVQLVYLKSGKPVTGLTVNDFVVQVDKQVRAIESVQYVIENGKKPYYLLAFKPIDAERGTGSHTAEIIATIEKRTAKASYKFTVPGRR